MENKEGETFSKLVISQENLIPYLERRCKVDKLPSYEEIPEGKSLVTRTTCMVGAFKGEEIYIWSPQKSIWRGCYVWEWMMTHLTQE